MMKKLRDYLLFGGKAMFALYNINSKRFFRIENEYHNCQEVDTFIEAKTFKTKKDAEYQNCLIKGDYIIIDLTQAKEMNILL
jgi:hypothetical protein